jgi:hypothetical protein
MLQLQANTADDQALGEQLNEAASRVNAVVLMSVSLTTPTMRTSI